MFTVQRITPELWKVGKTVRLAALKDAPFAFGTRYEDAVLRSDDQWRAIAAERAVGPDNALYLAFVEGEAVGIAGGYRELDDPSLAQLVSVWVAPEWRGSGVADRLIETVCDWAKSAGATRIIAWVTPNNDRALRFYNRRGFLTKSDRQEYPPNPDLCEILTVRRLVGIE